MQYRREIDGLRAIAVLAVIISHSGLSFLSGGFLGVDIFFVISGYLITYIIVENLQSGKFTFIGFYKKRILRIFPALFAMLLIVGLFSWAFLTPSDISEYSLESFFSILFLSNFYFLDQTGYFNPGSELMPLIHTWSLSIEEQFYLFFPLSVYLAHKVNKKSGIVLMILFLFILSFLVSDWGYKNKVDKNYFFTLSRFWELLGGSFIAISHIKDFNIKIKTSAIGVVLILCSLIVYDQSFPTPSHWTLIPVMGAMLVLLDRFPDSLGNKFLSLYPLRFIGVISFSAYLWHQPIFSFNKIIGIFDNYIGNILLMITAIFILSFFSWRYIEQPFRKRLFSDRLSYISLAILFVLIFSMSLIGYTTKLANQKYSNEDLPIISVTRVEANSYQRHISRPYENKKFNNDNALPKLLFIGDSFSRDFLNIINETVGLGFADISVRGISNECGPFLLYGESKAHVDSLIDSIYCNRYDRFQSENMMSTIKNADVIVLASHWHKYATDFIQEHVDNIRQIGSAKVILVGPKGFGNINQYDILKLNAAERSTYMLNVSDDLFYINNEFSKIKNATYIDIMKYVCKPLLGCRVLTDKHDLISFDGGHLTKSGAVYLGDKINQEYDLLSLLR